jgi:peroxiredoxin-like protein
MANHSFSVRAAYSGGADGYGDLSTTHLETSFAAPRELGGAGSGTNPEELLVAAAATCYLITLGAIAQRCGLGLVRVELESEGTVARDLGFRFERIIHRPTLFLGSDANEAEEVAALEAAVRAERACMVSAALHGNVAVSVEAAVVRAARRHVPPSREARVL